MLYPQRQPFPGISPTATHAVLTGGLLRRALIRATISSGFGEPDACLVLLSVSELPQLAGRISAHAESELVAQLAQHIRQATGAAFVGYEGEGRLCFMLVGRGQAQQRLQELSRQIVAAVFSAGGRATRLSPAIGYVPLSVPGSLNARLAYALEALAQARLCDDLQPVCYRPQRSPATGPLRRAAHLLAPLARRLRAPLQIAATIVLGFVLPLLVYAVLERRGLDVTPAIYLGTAMMLLVTSYLIWYEGFHALRDQGPPAAPAQPYPTASAIIAAYLPNEAATVVETIRAFLRLAYPGRLEIILAYNTPHDLPVEQTLRELAEREPRLRLLRVAGSTSKAQNVNAALAGVTGAFVGIFDADHHPDPDSFTRAWRWLAEGYDVVQGHCVIRNGHETWVARLVAVEFESIYAVAHPGRARVHGFGIFGGSNGYWRTEALRCTRLRASMLTEDIDASIRALIDGRKIAYDPLLISRELAPLTMRALWNQRMRWAQGWFQVSLKHFGAAMRSPFLSARQKLGMFHLLIWRELYPWLAMQIVAVLAFWALSDGFARLNLLIPIFVLTTALTFSSGLGQVLFGYLLGAPAIRRNWRWYLLYLLSATLFYSGLKDLISRVAMIKEALNERQWKVTPRETRAEHSKESATL